MFEVKFKDENKVPKAYYVCLLCGETLNTMMDCAEHWYHKHLDKMFVVNKSE